MCLLAAAFGWHVECRLEVAELFGNLAWDGSEWAGGSASLSDSLAERA